MLSGIFCQWDDFNSNSIESKTKPISLSSWCSHFEIPKTEEMVKSTNTKCCHDSANDQTKFEWKILPNMHRHSGTFYTEVDLDSWNFDHRTHSHFFHVPIINWAGPLFRRLCWTVLRTENGSRKSPESIAFVQQFDVNTSTRFHCVLCYAAQNDYFPLLSSPSLCRHFRNERRMGRSNLKAKEKKFCLFVYCQSVFNLFCFGFCCCCCTTCVSGANCLSQ